MNQHSEIYKSPAQPTLFGHAYLWDFDRAHYPSGRSAIGGTDWDHGFARRVRSAYVDPWEPAVAAIPSPTRIGASIQDFWDPASRPWTRRSPSEIRSQDWFGTVQPNFGPHVAEPLFPEVGESRNPEATSLGKAETILNIVGVDRPSRRRSLLVKLAELFDEYPHRQTFWTLRKYAEDGETSADDFVAAFSLKLVWEDSPNFSYTRDVVGRLWAPRTAAQRSAMLSWKSAIELARQCEGTPPESIIEPDWFHEWLDTYPDDPGYGKFLDYARHKIETSERGSLDAILTRSPKPSMRDLLHKEFTHIQRRTAPEPNRKRPILYRGRGH